MSSLPRCRLVTFVHSLLATFNRVCLSLVLEVPPVTLDLHPPTMRTRLSQVKMKSEEDPRVLFSQLASIQSAYNDTTRKIDQDDLIAVVLEKAADKYKSILTAEQRSKGTSLTLSDLNNCMNDLYRTMNSNKANGKQENKVSLAATSTKFNGNCNYCKKTRTYCKRLTTEAGRHIQWKCSDKPAPVQASWWKAHGP
jgi:hypothetical protein